MIHHNERMLPESENRANVPSPFFPTPRIDPSMQDRNTGFIDIDSIPAFQPVPGCNLRTPHGKQLMLSQVKMEEGAVIPLHHHPHEQGGL